MYVFVFSFDMHSDEPVTPDEVTDLVESLIDALDEPAVDPDISTTATGGRSLEVVMSISIEAPNGLQAQRAGLATVLRALSRAQITVHDFPLESTIVSSSTKVLTPA